VIATAINGSVANYQQPLQRQSTAPLEAVATVTIKVEIISRNFHAYSGYLSFIFK
jgi:hypothetical protein